MKKYYIYKIRNLINGEEYIGSRTNYNDSPCNDSYMGSSKYLNLDLKNSEMKNSRKKY